MKKTFHQAFLSLFSIFIVSCFCSIFLSGCYSPKHYKEQERPFPPYQHKIVVMGFQPVLSAGHQPKIIRSPLSGSVFMANSVSDGTVSNLTTSLFRKMTEKDVPQLVSPAEAKGVFSSLVSENSGQSDLDLAKRIGRAFSADGVLTGYLYRWRQRIGTDFAAEEPASVAFELYLIRPEDGAILWKGRFDKTQRSLSENLLDVDTFVQGGGKWMTAEKLADVGLQLMLKTIPQRNPEGEKKQ